MLREKIKKLFNRLSPCKFNNPLCKDSLFGCQCGTFIFVVAATVATAATVDFVIKSFQQPDLGGIEIPGGLAERGISFQITELLQEQAAELKKLHEEELKKEEEWKSIEEQKAQQEKLKEAVVKFGPLVLIGSAGLLMVIAKKRKKQ